MGLFETPFNGRQRFRRRRRIDALAFKITRESDQPRELVIIEMCGHGGQFLNTCHDDEHSTPNEPPPTPPLARWRGARYASAMPSDSLPPANMPPAPHIPVMLAEVLDALAPEPGDVIVDGTFGAGGYTSAILNHADCRVIAFDRDPTAIAAGQALVERFAPRLSLIEAPFSEMEHHVRAHPWFDDHDAAAASATADHAPRRRDPGQSPAAASVNAIVLDIGVSSMQLDRAERGFSFQHDGPLDMRMAADGPTAADFLNSASADEIADVLFQYGEERKSRLIARAIVHDRTTTPFTTTLQLAGLVARLLGRSDDGRHPATRTFQALRIHINDELGELERALAAAERLLKPGGRLLVVTFHSLEDRIVKKFFAERSGRAPAASRHAPATDSERRPSLRLVNRRPLTPSQPELDANPRSRSAGLRAAVRTEAPPGD